MWRALSLEHVRQRRRRDPLLDAEGEVLLHVGDEEDGVRGRYSSLGAMVRSTLETRRMVWRPDEEEQDVRSRRVSEEFPKI